MMLSLLASIASWCTPAVLFCVSNLMVGTIIIASSFQKQRHPHSVSDHSPHLVRSSSLLERVRSINFSLYKFDHHDSVHPDLHVQPPLARSPSLLERLKSLNFSAAYAHHQPHPSEQNRSADQPQVQTPLARAPSLLERVKSMKLPFSGPEVPDPNLPEAQQPAPSIDDEAHGAVEPLTQTRESEPDAEPEHHVTRIKSESGRDGPEKKAAKMSKSRSAKTVSKGEEEEVDRRRPATVRERRKVATFGEDEGVDAKADDFINKFKQELRLQRLDSLMRNKDLLDRGAAAK